MEYLTERATTSCVAFRRRNLMRSKTLVFVTAILLTPVSLALGQGGGGGGGGSSGGSSGSSGGSTGSSGSTTGAPGTSTGTSQNSVSGTGPTPAPTPGQSFT